ncbi:hypothetical protein H8959_001201 [Pygathrix nigripes]
MPLSNQSLTLARGGSGTQWAGFGDIGWELHPSGFIGLEAEFLGYFLNAARCFPAISVKSLGSVLLGVQRARSTVAGAQRNGGASCKVKTGFLPRQPELQHCLLASSSTASRNQI